MHSALKVAERWIRKLHYYLGLCFLFFLWLFSFSGLVLNHPGWKFAQFWPRRVQSESVGAVRPGHAGAGLERARELMDQCGLAGEIEWTVARQAPGHFRFRVARPGTICEIDEDRERGRAAVTRTAVNGWGVLSALHHFNGVRMNDDRNTRDWRLTSVWAFSMDALAAGLLFMLASGVYVWIRGGRSRLPGLVALLAGLLAAGLFLMIR